jgi:hypothetical protein
MSEEQDRQAAVGAHYDGDEGYASEALGCCEHFLYAGRKR